MNRAETDGRFAGSDIARDGATIPDSIREGRDGTPARGVEGSNPSRSTSNADDDYKRLARELLALVDAWKKARWWERWAIANAIACKVWFRSAELQSALLYHREGMKAAQSASRSDLLHALTDLHDDTAEYISINNLTGYDNHVMRRAREAIKSATGREHVCRWSPRALTQDEHTNG